MSVMMRRNHLLVLVVLVSRWVILIWRRLLWRLTAGTGTTTTTTTKHLKHVFYLDLMTACLRSRSLAKVLSQKLLL